MLTVAELVDAQNIATIQAGSPTVRMPQAGPLVSGKNYGIGYEPLLQCVEVQVRVLPVSFNKNARPVAAGRANKTDSLEAGEEKIAMQKSNVNPCPHTKGHAHIIRTSDGRTAVMCPTCLAELEGRLADPVLIHGMLKSIMTMEEIQQMRHERENMALELKLSEAVATFWAVAGYPQRLAIAAPVV